MSEDGSTSNELEVKQERALAMIMQGEKDVKIAASLGINRTTIYRWRKYDTEFMEALDERHSLLCPYREDIRSARNNKEIIDQHSEAIEKIQSALGDQKGVNAKTAAALASLSGIIGSALTTLVSRFLGG